MGSHSAKQAAEPGQALFKADNSEACFETQGICYRNSKKMEDRKTDGQMLPWNCSVAGVDEGDHWLRVRSHYLPMKVNGYHVIKKVEDDVNTVSTAPHLFAPTDQFKSGTDAHQSKVPLALAPVVQRCAELADEHRLQQLEAEIQRLTVENAELMRDPAPSEFRRHAPDTSVSSTALSGELAALEEALSRKRREMDEHDRIMESRRHDLAGKLSWEEEQLREKMRLREEAHRMHEEELAHHRRFSDNQKEQAAAFSTRIQAEHEKATERLRFEHQQLTERMRAEHDQLRIEHEEERRRLEAETQRFRDAHREARGLERVKQDHDEERRRLEAEMQQFRELHRMEQDKLRSEQERSREEALLRQQREDALRREAARQEEIARQEDLLHRKEAARREEHARREEEEAAAKKRREDALRQQEEELRREAARLEEMARQQEIQRREREEAARREELARRDEEEKRRREEAARSHQQREEERMRREEEENLRRRQQFEGFRKQRAEDDDMLKFKSMKSIIAEERQRREWHERDWRRGDHTGATPYSSSPLGHRGLYHHKGVDRDGVMTPRALRGFEGSTLSSTGTSAFSRSPGAPPPSNGYPYPTRSGALRDDLFGGASLSSTSSTRSSSQKRHQISSLLTDLDKLAGDLQSVFHHRSVSSPVGTGPSPRSRSSPLSPNFARGSFPD